MRKKQTVDDKKGLMSRLKKMFGSSKPETAVPLKNDIYS